MRKLLSKKFLGLAVAAGLLLGVGAVVAQVTLPQVTSINPTQDRVQIIPRGQPSAQSVYASPGQLVATSQYQYVNTATPSSSYLVFTFANADSDMVFDFGGSVLAYAYITFAPNPSDGARQCFVSRGGITALYPSANTGQTLRGTVTTLAANTRNCWLYNAANAYWVRVQ